MFNISIMTTELKNLRNDIEKLDKIHQIHILGVLKSANIDYTENTNGVFINMTILDASTIKEISDYISYVKLQQTQLDKIEKDKERYKKEFYKDNKANASYNL